MGLESFTRGENPIFIDVYDQSVSGRGLIFTPTGNEVDIRANLGYTRNYANRLNLKNMTPQPAICSTGYCLAGNSEYLAYLSNAGSIPINLTSTRAH
ncbi:MAG TPA: hypothetical protein VJ785_03345 [Anaerolineales bacterium]|nr:hypothetical protein [Anaerolineales bacterium]